ncbi:hypothetical protein [Flavobacterium sp. FlaQc-50]|jgi:hypothetical protein|uniref:hypothetical protein n=1 Tax=unclassified Flavobacterium TaxID=196869 RepID=UPI0037579162
MNQIKELILKNDFKNLNDYLLQYEDKESELRSLIYPLCDEYGLSIIYILLDVAYSRNISFWFNQVGYFLSFSFSHINGAERMALAMFKKSFEIDSNDVLTLRAILDFNNPPEIILTEDEYKYYSEILNEKF